MTEMLKATLRLKKKESLGLRDLSLSLTKQAVNDGHTRFFDEADLVHFIIEKTLTSIEVTPTGYLCIDRNKMNTTISELEYEIAVRVAKRSPKV